MKSPVSRGIEESPSNERNNHSHKHYCPICMLYFKAALETRCCNNTMCDACATAVVSRSAGQAALHNLIEAHTPPRPTNSSRQQQDAVAVSAAGPAVLPPPVFTTPRVSTTSTTNHRHYVRQTALLRDGSGLLAPPASITVVPCPFCQRNLKLKIMDDKVVSKSYEDSPMVQRFRNNVANGSRLSSCENAGDDSVIASDTSLPLSADTSVYSNTMATFRQGSHNRSTETVPVAKVCLTSPVKTGDTYDALRRKLVALPLWGPKPTGTTSAQPSTVTAAAAPIPSATALPRIAGRERRTLSTMQAKKPMLPALVPVTAKKDPAPAKSSWCPIM